MLHEVVKDCDGLGWRVKAIDYENEDMSYVSLFIGHGDEERARKYALFKNGQTDES